ncbi:MAG: ShlB/FhaC/HecB family hemolysin secretion/activation protein [Novosphingobium sp.]
MTNLGKSIPALVLAAGATLSLPAPSFAQNAGSGTLVTPSEQLKPPTPESRAPSTAKVDAHAAFQPGPCPLPENLSVTIREIHFTAPGGGELAPDLARLLADVRTDPAPQSVRVVCQLRDMAIERLRTARYIASVQIPPQKIEGGILNLEVVSGHIVEVRVHGEPGPYRRLLERRIAALKAMEPLNEADAEQLLLLAGDVPGLTVKLGLSPAGTRPGELIGDLEITFRRVRVVANVQNYNSAPLGRESAYVRTELFGLTGLGDVTSIAGLVSFDFKKQLIAQVSHQMQLDSRGVTLALTGTFAESRPALTALDLRTISKVANLELAAPIRRSINTNINTMVGFEYAEQRTRVYPGGASQPLFRDRIAALYSRFTATTRKMGIDGRPAYLFGASLEFRKGLNILGANKTGQIDAAGYAPSRFEGSGTAAVIRADVNGQIGIGPIFELWARGHGQYTNRPLLNYDEFAIGNLTLGRGYDPGANSGDRMIGGSLEARANIKLAPTASGQLFGFYDIVKLRNLDTGTTEANRTLKSVGAGFRVTAFSSARLEVTYAHPLDPPLLTGTNVKRASDKVLASLTVQLVPFGPNR